MVIRKDRWFWLVSFLSITSLFLYTLSKRSPSVSEEAEERIQFGMTEDQVLTILKAPPGDYRTRTVLYGGLQRSPQFIEPWAWDFHDPFKVVEQEPLRMETWTTDYGEMKVWFDKKGNVAGKCFNNPAASVSWLEDKYESILVRLGLRQPRCWCVN